MPRKKKSSSLQGQTVAGVWLNETGTVTPEAFARLSHPAVDPDTVDVQLTLEDMQEAIRTICGGIESLLISKNQSYGNSVANPKRVFSRCSWREAINIRIDDKISRIASGGTFGGEDTRSDLIGYLVLEKAIDYARAKKLAAGTN